jgi:hypothetical protein
MGSLHDEARNLGHATTGCHNTAELFDTQHTVLLARVPVEIPLDVVETCYISWNVGGICSVFMITTVWTNKRRRRRIPAVDEGRKRAIGIMAAILSAMHMQRADDLFGMPNGTPITDRVIEASIQWAERIMQRIDSLHSK